ncbi:MAG TPA: hypothetical protein HA257_05630 [Candidatus Methanoperedenaceae archaeon]|nr:hypothetical protein [Candidatus Methanoperedenaceae archaeon]
MSRYLGGWSWGRTGTMSNLKILALMFREEFRLQASFFNRTYVLTSAIAIVLFTFIMGLSLPMLRRVVAMEDMLLVAHWVLLFYGLGVGGFALFGDRILERRFGSVSLLLGSGYTLPVRFRRLFFLFYIKDTLYYVFLTILPMIAGLALSAVFVPVSLPSLAVLYISLTLSFLLGISISVLIFTVLARLGAVPVLAFIAALVTYLAFSGGSAKEIAAGHPALAFYYSRSPQTMILLLAASVLLAIVSSLFVKEMPAPRERKAGEAFRRLYRITSGITRGYAPLVTKDMIDLVRSGIIFPVIMTFLMPLLFLYAVVWFIDSVMLIDLGFSLLFYAAMVGFFCTLLYSWLSNIDISECYNSLPMSMPWVIRSKLILFGGFTCLVAIPYLAAVGYLRGELDLIWISLLIMLTVSAYVGSVLAYLTGLFTNSYLLDAKILIQFALAVVPVLAAQTLLTFYFRSDSTAAMWLITILGALLLAASAVLLNRLGSHWDGRLFRIA